MRERAREASFERAARGACGSICRTALPRIAERLQGDDGVERVEQLRCHSGARRGPTFERIPPEGWGRVLSRSPCSQYRPKPHYRKAGSTWSATLRQIGTRCGREGVKGPSRFPRRFLPLRYRPTRRAACAPILRCSGGWRRRIRLSGAAPRRAWRPLLRGVRCGEQRFCSFAEGGQVDGANLRIRLNGHDGGFSFHNVVGHKGWQACGPRTGRVRGGGGLCMISS